MTSNHHAPYDLGYTRATMAGTTGSEGAIWSESYKSHSQFGLQAATRLHEVGIASNRGSECHGEYVPGRSEEHTSELQSRGHLVCRLLLEKKKKKGEKTKHLNTHHRSG